MKILFNKGTNGSEELSLITGNFYASNNFDKIKMDILLETEKLVRLIGKDVYQLAEDAYHASSVSEGDLADLIAHIQLPIAIAATIAYHKATIVSHEDGGRKLKVDKDNEVVPWEWMFERDDQAQERKMYRAIDRLINYLDQSGLEEWNASEARKGTKSLFVNSAAVFQQTYPIDDSGRFYYQVTPFISEIERTVIRKSLGDVRYKELMLWHQSLESSQDNDVLVAGDLDNSLLLALIRDCVPLLTMVIACERLSLSILPEGVVQQFTSMMQTMKASQVALDETKRKFLLSLRDQASEKLDELKTYILSADPNASNYDLLPNNTCDQKFFRT